ncbi:MAG: SusC/RagA family TonB-linked outer membrane protein [Candidatus Pseudobacter hemicellulosilyticus]|uniref:SusC/RagA family TonB-linked outer membrane protein n=1 Tax=Candidatus Pseudobacter hemicellulosilyticus TaxID=3121375 RepID=A0AAJ5WRQ6_9BACT|nr:MAG: SusC/RagA family TonB-linked outer membrane protein [Pseudobacter sp.]
MNRKFIQTIFVLLGVAVSASAQVNPDTTGMVQVPARNGKGFRLANPVVQAGFWKLHSSQVTGAISTVRADDIASQPVNGIKSALQGQMAGLYTVQANGLPASEVALRLRGVSSIYGETDPLFILDGVPLFTGPREMAPSGVGGNWGATFNPLADININDIQSIDVLKDAAATAMYGARGANGVIVITTRNATVNRGEVRLDAYGGVTEATNRRGVITNGQQYLSLLDQAWANSGQTGEGPLPAITGLNRTLAAATNTDNMDALLRSGNVQNLSLSATHGTARSSFFFAGSVRNEDGILTNNDYTKYTGRLKFQNQLTKRVSLGANAGIVFAKYRGIPTGYGNGGGFNAAQTNLPVLPFYTENGGYFYQTEPAIYNLPGTNVRSFLDLNEFENAEETRRISLATNFGLNLMPGLDLRLDAAYDQFQHRRRDYLSKRMRFGSLGSGTGREGLPLAYASFEKETRNVVDVLATINFKRMWKDHNLTALAGMEFYYGDNPYFFGEGEGFVSDAMRQPSMASYRNQVTAAGLTTNTHAILGFFATANYVYSDRYLLNATVRMDASSRFGADNKYQVYPALGAGYLLIDERLGDNHSIVNLLKLRASYGWSGNYGVGNYSSLERWGLTANSRYLMQAGIQALSLGSPSLKPERLDQANIGIEFSLLQNRINGGIDLYNRITRNMVLLYPTPLSLGQVAPGLLLNGGKMRNQGVELSLTTRNITAAFTWTTGLNIAFNKNKVLDLDGLGPAEVSAHPNVANFVGYATGTYYLARYAGIDASTGQEMILDKDGNKVAATSAAQIDAARVPLDKTATPKFFGGLTNSFGYKQFDLSALITFAAGNYILDEGERELSYLKGKNNLLTDALNSWTSSHRNTDFPRLLYNDPIAGSNTTRFLHDGSYVRLKNIALGYSFKKAIGKIKFLKDVRVYAAAQNLVTLTSFPGWDPEVSGSYLTNIERSQHLGVTYLDLPQIKSFVLGLNVRL